MWSRLRNTACLAQLVQTGPGDISRRVVPQASTDCPWLRRRVLEKGLSLLGPHVRVSVEFVDRIPHAPTGEFAGALPPGGREARRS